MQRIKRFLHNRGGRIAAIAATVALLCCALVLVLSSESVLSRPSSVANTLPPARAEVEETAPPTVTPSPSPTPTPAPTVIGLDNAVEDVFEPEASPDHPAEWGDYNEALPTAEVSLSEEERLPNGGLSAVKPSAPARRTPPPTAPVTSAPEEETTANPSASPTPEATAKGNASPTPSPTLAPRATDEDNVFDGDFTLRY